MAKAKDATLAIKRAAAGLPGAVAGESCNQVSYKVGRKAYLYIGPGKKGVGYKAMFSLDDSLSEAKKLAAQDPQRFEVGAGNWATTRFSDEEPLPEGLWNRWLSESYKGASEKK